MSELVYEIPMGIIDGIFTVSNQSKEKTFKINCNMSVQNREWSFGFLDRFILVVVEIFATL